MWSNLVILGIYIKKPLDVLLTKILKSTKPRNSIRELIYMVIFLDSEAEGSDEDKYGESKCYFFFSFAFI